MSEQEPEANVRREVESLHRDVEAIRAQKALPEYEMTRSHRFFEGSAMNPSYHVRVE